MKINDAHFATIVARANLAPSIHNAQPARWRQVDGGIQIAADRAVALPYADPAGSGIALSMGAAVEATMLAMSEQGLAAAVTDHWADENLHSWPGCRLAAMLTLAHGPVDQLAAALSDRGTWRGGFEAGSPDLFGWTREDMRLIFDAATKARLAARNDISSLAILRGKPFRAELLSWMRLTETHTRAGLDGMDQAALNLTSDAARKVALGLGPLWSIFDLFGRTKDMTSEAGVTRAAPMIAAFHRPRGESPIDTGRAYLRMWLEATKLGLAAWPMAALTDDTVAKAELETMLGLDPERQLIQVLRLGVPTAKLPAKARRPISEITG